MKSLLSAFAIGGFFTMLAILTGCSSSQKAGSEEADAGMHGMMCPNCKTVWVAEKKGSISKVSRLTYEQGMTCPDCDAMAESVLLQDGKVQLHDCPNCIVTPIPIEPTKHNSILKKGAHS